MYCVSVRFQVDPESFAAFVARTEQQASDSLAREAGCRRFEVWTNAARPGEVLLHEVYADAAAFAAHLASDHFRAYDADTTAQIRDKSVSLWDRRHAP
ncbi:MAG: putative quinol monooxygenase [Rhodospirillales bacterium]